MNKVLAAILSLLVILVLVIVAVSLPTDRIYNVIGMVIGYISIRVYKKLIKRNK